MKFSFLLAGLIALAPLTSAHGAASQNAQEVVIDQDVVSVAYALSNVSEDALALAEKLAKANLGSVAGYALADLVDETERLERSAKLLALALDDEGSSDDEILDALSDVELRYARASKAQADATSKLYAAGKTADGYALRSAYTKVRSRLAYLQLNLAGE